MKPQRLFTRPKTQDHRRKTHDALCLSALLLLSFYTGAVMADEKHNTATCKKSDEIPMSVEFPKDLKGTEKGIAGAGYAVQDFVSFLNKSDPCDRIGYRFHEHTPFVYGAVPEKSSESQAETAKAEALEKQYAARTGVFVHTIDVNNSALRSASQSQSKEGWAPQTWTYYIVPVADGFELLWVIATKDNGLNEYYSAQQCFRMSGKNNSPWRRAIAETPAFSEYDLWQTEQAHGLPKTSLSFVHRSGKWQEIPATEEHIVCRTPLGLSMDRARSGGDLSKIAEMKPSFSPRSPSHFEPDIDCALITRSNLENNRLCGIYWERTTHISNHHPADCLHCFVNIGPLAPNSKRAIRGRIYWMKASKDELYAQWLKESFSD